MLELVHQMGIKMDAEVVVHLEGLECITVWVFPKSWRPSESSQEISALSVIVVLCLK